MENRRPSYLSFGIYLESINATEPDEKQIISCFSFFVYHMLCSKRNNVFDNILLVLQSLRVYRTARVLFGGGATVFDTCSCGRSFPLRHFQQSEPLRPFGGGRDVRRERCAHVRKSRYSCQNDNDNWSVSLITAIRVSHHGHY